MNDLLKTKNYEETIYNLLRVWKLKGLCYHHFEVVKKEMFIQNRLLGIYRNNLDIFGSMYFYKAILNYSIVVGNPQSYWYRYKWLFWDFMERGYKKFTEEAQPLENFKISKKTINVGDNFGR